MTVVLFAIGAAAATVLIALLLRTLVDRHFRIWPTPLPGSWQSRVFWTLFRLVNVMALTIALSGWLCEISWLPAPLAGSNTAFGPAHLNAPLALPSSIRSAAFLGFAVTGILYGYALLALGKSNTYCNRDGLVTHGIYRWTRNPQYATIIPVYALLAVATDSVATYVLAASLIVVYTLMALVEEPWLEASYGDAYRRYRRRVPRFFNWPRLLVLLKYSSRRWQLSPVGRDRNFGHVKGGTRRPTAAN